MEDLNKDQLHEAYQLAKSMGKAFRAFKNTEEFILQVIQLKANFDQYADQVNRKKIEAETAAAETADLVGKRDVARAELDQEVVRLAEYRKNGLAEIQAGVVAARDAADQAISSSRAEVTDAKHASDDARKEHEGLLASLHAEISAKQQVRDELQAYIDALKQKFS